MNTWWHDLKYASRTLRKSPGFTFLCVISLSLGIGANTAIFTIVDAVLIRSLPYRDVDRLVLIWEDASHMGYPENSPAPGNYMDWKEMNQVFENVQAMTSAEFNLTGSGDPQEMEAYGVTAGFLDIFGINPVIGRTFLAEEDRPGENKVTVLSYRLWQSRFAGDRNVVDSSVFLNQEKYTVVGVMPAHFQFLNPDTDLWVPAGFTSEQLAERGDHFLTVVGRLRSGVTVEKANAELGVRMRQIAKDYPDQARGLGAFVVPIRDQISGDVRRPLVILLGAVAFVLLVTCANVGGLLLSRSVSRNKEMAIRFALGAGKLRITRQLLMESLMLSGMGGVAGIFLSVWSFSILKNLIPAEMMLTTGLEINWNVLFFTLVVSQLAGLIFGLAPTLQLSRLRVEGALHLRANQKGLSVRARMMRNAFVIAEIGLALVLLSGAALMIKTVNNLIQQYSSLDPENVLTVRTTLSGEKYREYLNRVSFYDQVLERIGRLPGVQSAGYTTSVPLAWKGGSTGFTVEGRTSDPNEIRDVVHRQVSSEYLQAMQVPLKEGRFFDARDTSESMKVVIINRALARGFWPDESAVGKRMKFGPPDSRRPWLTIIGVTSDVRQMGTDAPVKPEAFVLYSQTDYFPWYAPRDLVIRTDGKQPGLVTSVRQQVLAVDPNQPISNIRTMEQLLGQETTTRRMGMIFLTAFASLAILLASLGIYGVLSFFVTQNTSEIGLRMALGAAPRNILALILKKGMILVGIGILVGLPSALALVRLLQSQLFEVNAWYPPVFIAGGILILVVALLACLIPAWGGMKLRPLDALRYE